MDGGPAIIGHVQGFAAGITDSQRTASPTLLANVNPTFTWVRLAQRVPVRIALDHVPAGTKLIAGMTCTVVIGGTKGSGRFLKKAAPKTFLLWACGARTPRGPAYQKVFALLFFTKSGRLLPLNAVVRIEAAYMQQETQCTAEISSMP